MAPAGAAAAGFAWAMKDPPLVQRKSLGVRQRLRGPTPECLPQDQRALLSHTATTVSESGLVRFGDQLLLLNHATEVVLQADVSRTETVIDESHSSDLRLVSTAFGVECGTFAEALENVDERRVASLSHGFDSGIESDRRLCAVWSFVNDTWVDQVDHTKSNLEGASNTWTWKEDAGDDFKDASRAAPQPDPVEFNPLEGEEKNLLEQEHKLLSEDPRTNVCNRMSLVLRSRGVHFIRKMRKMCEESDVLSRGVVPAHTFEGILAARVIRLSASEFQDIVEVFEADIVTDSDVAFIDYAKFFWFLEGILPEERLDSVKRAYRKLQKIASANYVDVNTLMEHWNPECSREVQDGTMDHKEACQEFIAQWDAANADGHISPEEFLRYYRDVSLCYEDGEEFVEMLRVAWDL